MEKVNIEEGFYWRYWHFFREGLFSFNIIEHATDIFGLSKTAYVSISGSVFNKNIRATKQLEICPQPFEVRENVAYFFPEEDFSINAHFNLEKDSVARNFQDTPFIINPKNDTQKNYWNIFLVSKSVQIKLQSEEMHWAGACSSYSDCQWGNLVIQDFLNEWIWIHVSNKKESRVFFRVRTSFGDNVYRRFIRDFEVRGGKTFVDVWDTKEFDIFLDTSYCKYVYRHAEEFLEFSVENTLRTRSETVGARRKFIYSRHAVITMLPSGKATGIAETMRIY